MKKKREGVLERKRESIELYTFSGIVRGKKGRRRAQSTSFQYRINSIGNAPYLRSIGRVVNGALPDECLM